MSSYCEEQPIAYEMIKKAIENNKIAHAYLFCLDNDAILLDFALGFAKTLFCPEFKIFDNNCEKCHICHRINGGNYPELKIINPDGLWIKKDQLLELQESFRMKPLEGNKKIYIINGADKLNVQAANSILKFLEEPEQNIIAILTSNDIHKVLPTIVSRCQVITLKDNKKQNEIITKYENIENKSLIKIGYLFCKSEDDLTYFLNDANNVTKLDSIILFIKRYETLGLDVILDMKQLWIDHFNDKEEYLWAFDVMTLFYKDVINCIYNRKLDVFFYYADIVESVAEKNELDRVIHKIQNIIAAKEKVKYNTNLSLLLDKLIIEMESEEVV